MLRRVLAALLIAGLAACSLLPPNLETPDRPRRPTRTPAPAEASTLDVPPPTATSEDAPWSDESAVMGGICFESAYDAAGQTFIIHNEQELTALFDLADNSDLCRQPVGRGSFDFGENRILVGLWSKGVGCRAHHTVESLYRDETISTIYVYVHFVAEGTCTYELIRPFWVGLRDAADYNIQIVLR